MIDFIIIIYHKSYHKINYDHNFLCEIIIINNFFM